MTGTVAHRSVLIAFHFSLSHAFSASVLVETGLTQPRLFIGVIFPHTVFAHQPITKFLVAELLLFTKCFIWVTHAELIAELLLSSKKASFFTFYFALLFDFALCDVGHFFVAQSHSIDVPRWSALSISSHSRIIFVSFFCGH